LCFHIPRDAGIDKRKKLDQLGVKYEYFDGSTAAPDREKAIQSFQNDESVRVFLIH
jgi:non-specific serine/threonine protein kinase